MKINLLHIQKVTGIAGSETHLLHLLSSLNPNKYQVSFLILEEPRQPTDSYASLLKDRGIRTLRLPIRRDVDLNCLIQIYRLMRQGRYDIVHTHLVHGEWYGALAAKLAAIPLLVTTKHNDDPFKKNFIIRTLTPYIQRNFQKVITISQYLAQFSSRWEQIPKEKIEVIPYGLPPTDHPEGPTPFPFLISIGRLTEQKGHRYLLFAFQKVLKRHPNLKLVLLGNGELREHLEALCRKLRLFDTVIFPGWVDSLEAQKWLRQAILLVHPSLWEGFGLVLLEAMLAKKSIVASRLPAIQEIVAHEETGILVPPKDIQGLAEAICHLIEHPEKCRQMGQRGWKRADKHFSLECMVRKTEILYETLLQQSFTTLS